MEPNLEIQDWQRKPELKNPLTQEQAAWVEKQILEELRANSTILQWDPVQEAAERLLQQGASLSEIYRSVELF
jgi:hypothetical protein